MPGIAGIISKKSCDECKNDLQRMIQTMLHENFYNYGMYSDSSFGFYGGWICHEGSFSDCMPVWNEKKDVVMIYFGENYTDLDLFDQLKAKHHRFDRNNASYIIHLYEELGVDFIKKLNGWFSGIIYDDRKKKAYLFNDRYGTQKIFYYLNRNDFYFSSEAKSILEIFPHLRVMDNKAIAEYVSCDCVLENRTFFKDVFLLPTASLWEFSEGKETKKTSYFNYETWENQPWLEKEYFYERLRETVRKIIPRYFRGDRKIGISLTGGLDTRVIVANAEMPPGKFPCYTFGGIYRESYDVKVARKVAKILNQKHHVLQLGKEFLDDFEKYAEKTIYITDGYLDASNAYELYLNKKAREIAPVRITGNYGGEVLRGMGGFLKATPPKTGIYNKDLNFYFKEAKRTVERIYNSSINPMSINFFTEIPWFRNHRFVIEQSQLTPRTPYLDNDLVALMYRAPMEVRKNMEITLRLISDANHELGIISSDRGFGGHRKIFISNFAEIYFNFLMKAEYTYNYGMPQWLVKIDFLLRSLAFEKIFLGRHKFAHYRIWFREFLSRYIEELLLDERSLSRSYINKKVMRKVVKQHLKGVSNFTLEISKVLSLELTNRIFIDKR